MKPGDKFGRLTAICPTDQRISGSIVWKCICDCGNEKMVSRLCLVTAKVKSCGCLNLQSQRETHTKHGMHATPTWHAWKDMKARCSNPNLPNYQSYGGRGITVCERWRTSFQNFLQDMGVRPDEMTIERIDNNGNYEPGNCRWATRFEQASNTRRNRFVEIAGQRKTVSQLAREIGVSRHFVRDRLNRGMTPEQVVAIA